MKNFYEATVTKPTLTPTIELMLTPVEQCVCVALINGNVVHDGLLDSHKSILVKGYPINGPIDFMIIVTRQHPEAVEIKVVVDGHEIIPLYQAHANPPTNYLDFNGKWTLHIPNFYPWYHEVTGQGWIV